jgi:hypothetical protein
VRWLAVKMNGVFAFCFYLGGESSATSRSLAMDVKFNSIYCVLDPAAATWRQLNAGD